MVNADDRLNSLFHYMQGVEPFSQIFGALTKSTRQWCPFTHGKGLIDPDCYNAHGGIKAILEYFQKYVLCARLLDANRYAVDEMVGLVGQLSRPESLKDHQTFREVLNQFERQINFVEPGIVKKLRQISCEECGRLDEALVCFSNYAFMASVAMAVSAVEARIIQIIRKKNRRLYQSQFRNATLGQLIQIFDDDKYKEAKYSALKKQLPAKHKPLLLLLNQYRIFSVHPKEERVTAQTSETILHLAFAFITDHQTCPYTPEELKHHMAGEEIGTGGS
jgi:hypothetical protein